MREDELFDGVVHDSNNLADPPRRRLNLSMLDKGDREVVVLNAVADEFGRCVASSERRRWSRELRRRQVPLAAQARVLEDVQRAARRWLAEELERPDGILRKPPLTNTQELSVLELSLAMPTNMFTGRDGPQKDVDRAMVAEAAVTGRTLLLTEDQSTIRHEAVNRWLIECGWTDSRTLLQTNSVAHQRMEQLVGPNALYEWMLGAFLPDQASGRDVGIIERNAGQLQQAGMVHAARRVLQELRADPDPEATFAKVRTALPHRARAAEARRVRAVRSAASDAGWSPPEN